MPPTSNSAISAQQRPTQYTPCRVPSNSIRLIPAHSAIAACLRRTGAAFVHECPGRPPGEVTGIEPLDTKARARDQVANAAMVQMAPAAYAPPSGREAILPPANARVGCPAMLDKEQAAAGAQHAAHLAQGF